jgi:hypothetical protein
VPTQKSQWRCQPRRPSGERRVRLGMPHDSGDLSDREAATASGRDRPSTYDQPIALARRDWSNEVRCVLALGFLITLCASASGAMVHRLKRSAYAHQRVAVHPSQRVTAPSRFAIPGWTDEETKDWLDNASRGSHEG